MKKRSVATGSISDADALILLAKGENPGIPQFRNALLPHIVKSYCHYMEKLVQAVFNLF